MLEQTWLNRPHIKTVSRGIAMPDQFYLTSIEITIQKNRHVFFLKPFQKNYKKKGETSQVCIDPVCRDACSSPTDLYFRPTAPRHSPGPQGVGAGRRWMGNRGETGTNVATKQMRYRDIWEFKGKWRQRDANKKMSMNVDHQNHFVSIGSCLLLVLCGFCRIIFFWYPFGTWWHFLVGWIQGAAHKTWEKSHGKCWQPFTLSVFVTQTPPIP